MEEVDDLVLTPFKDIVEKAKLAIQNAGDGNPEMLQAAQTLLKEGERGLKKITPVCKKQFDDYGPVFIASLKDHDEIANFRTHLTDLLWDFDDYVEPDEFDADKFTELRAASRKAAPKIFDILTRMKLEAPASDATSSRGSIAQLPTPTSPPLHLSNPIPPPLGFHRGSGSGSGSPSSALADIHDATAQLRNMMRSPSTGSHRDLSREPPRPPSGNPWDWHSRPPAEDHGSEERDDERRAVLNESPVLPTSTPHEVRYHPFPVVHPPPASVVGSASSQVGVEEDTNRLSTGSQQTTSDRGQYIQHPQYNPHRSNSHSRQPNLPSFSIPEHEATEPPGMIPVSPQPSAPFTPSSPHPRHPSYAPTIGSDTSEPTPPRLDLVRMPSTDSRARSESLNTSGFSPIHGNPSLQIPPSQPAPPQPAPLIPISPEHVAQMDSYPIPVETEHAPKPFSPTAAQIEECRITQAASFHLVKGFCEGAREVIRGGVGVKRIKKPGFATSATVARCLNCLYEMDFADIETDVNRLDKGNYSRNGIAFRVRFLQKSHIGTRRADDIQYGCVFCVQQGHTIDKSDATVFFNQKALFDHLARHPRPLPEVPGLTVIEGDQVPEKFRNDYDLHFRNPPQLHPVVVKSDQVIGRPSGVAKDHARRMYGWRLLYDRSPALELAQGARITGLTWPPQYMGEWCFGWHDGHYASVPADLVRLDQPPRSEVRYDRLSAVRGVARWKFSVKEKDKDKERDKEEWLKFDKNETINNIAWVDENHWCWSGTNAKGKWGIFPSAYIEPASMREPSSSTSAGRANSVKEENARYAMGLMGRFSRKGSARPPSVSGTSINS